ncbi:hypothetical protein COU12_02645 [Candidatus Jorgensenbacteria bacterium CG10_big_fil_rev_8_21_14_0_10_54_38]|uniref:Uncharacterized protein n=2 Tax=Candidatus Joergenseniibacteriota TaxID=1752739 RepID=A0A2M6WFH4_9BACT|nr:MAG: hypothetical protein COX26_01830 [Candidatus Jorgensenbacteria bacterium CG23_combo_of_CG06-09_8_20_14_all_54_14]PIT91525.1 MAG: hypothetical protein COU12_02645 [Candidatus Jorgensenbacteria bacterium CG10_big_fil_rev_8_21_14_0_10_54_38]
MKTLPGTECVEGLLALCGFIAHGVYRLPLMGILRCEGTGIVIPIEKVVDISEMQGKARVEVVVDVQDNLRRELKRMRNGKLIDEEEIGEKIKLSILVSPDDPWTLKLGRDADGLPVFLKNLNA